MWILVITFVLIVLGESVLVGMAAAALSRRLRWEPGVWLLSAIFLAVFAILETFYLPALRVLDARLEIRNPELARLIGPGSPIELSEWLTPSLEDPLWWALQSAIALVSYRIAMR